MTSGIIPPVICVGRTEAERYRWLMTHLTRREVSEIVARRVERIAWLRDNNPRALEGDSNLSRAREQVM
jgi:hypothetical protein